MDKMYDYDKFGNILPCDKRKSTIEEGFLLSFNGDIDDLDEYDGYDSGNPLSDELEFLETIDVPEISHNNTPHYEKIDQRSIQNSKKTQKSIKSKLRAHQKENRLQYPKNTPKKGKK